MNDEQKILSTQKLLDIISKKNTALGNDKIPEMQRVLVNGTKDRKRPLIYLFIGVFTGIIATGGVFYLLNSPPDSKPTKPTAAAIVQTASSDSNGKKILNTDVEKTLLTDRRVIEEIQRHLWIESEKAGFDIGFDKAKEDWLKNFSRAWMQYHFPDVLRADKNSVAEKPAQAAMKRRRAKSYFR